MNVVESGVKSLDPFLAFRSGYRNLSLTPFVFNNYLTLDADLVQKFNPRVHYFLYI